MADITPEQLSKKLSDLIPPVKINYKDPSEVIRSFRPGDVGRN
jgi:hypothetical protein